MVRDSDVMGAGVHQRWWVTSDDGTVAAVTYWIVHPPELTGIDLPPATWSGLGIHRLAADTDPEAYSCPYLGDRPCRSELAGTMGQAHLGAQLFAGGPEAIWSWLERQLQALGVTQ